ncbi:MAG: SPFH domain-containing protein [Anaerolineales bacterium]
MARIIDVLDHVNVMDDELSYREPQEGGGDFRMGSVVNVQEHQAAVFVSRGRVMDVLGPGSHTLSTANLPVLSNFIGMVTNGRNPFTADVYFINLKPMHDVRWGTNPPIELATDDGIGKLFLMGNGVAELRISDPAVFMAYAVGKPIVRIDDLRTQIQAMLVGQLTQVLSRGGVKNPQEANAMMDNVEGAVLATLNEGFARLGMAITAFEANPFQRKQLTTEEAAELFGSWEQRMQLEQLDVQRTAAGNEGMLGGTMGAGLGWAFGQQMGNQMNPQAQQQQMMQQQMMMQQMQQMMNQMQQGNQPGQAAPAGGGGGGNQMPQTPEEIQNFLDMLDMRFMNGEISESTYNTMRGRWEERLNQMGGNGE